MDNVIVPVKRIRMKAAADFGQYLPRIILGVNKGYVCGLVEIVIPVRDIDRAMRCHSFRTHRKRSSAVTSTLGRLSTCSVVFPDGLTR